MKLIKYKAIDNLGVWIYGIPQTTSTLHLTLDCMAQYFTEQRKYARENVIIIPKTLCEYTGINDIKDIEIYENDLILDKVYDIEAPNGQYYESKLPVFFEKGAFWVDESYKKDRTTATLLCEWKNPLICGNIFDKK